MQSVTFTPPAVAPGGNVTVVQTIKNVAAAPGSAGASTSRLFLSLNRSAPTSVGELGLFSVPPIAAGATTTVSTPLVIPGGTAPGLYYVAASANVMGFVPEAHVENNLATSLWRLIVGPERLRREHAGVRIQPRAMGAGHQRYSLKCMPRTMAEWMLLL